jgi:hypothetical protein
MPIAKTNARRDTVLVVDDAIVVVENVERVVEENPGLSPAQATASPGSCSGNSQ